jgi:hypothetical protein
MKFINLILLYFILSLSSCGTNSNKYKFNDPKDLAHIILKSLNNNDTLITKHFLFNDQIDSLFIDSINYNFAIEHHKLFPINYNSQSDAIESNKNRFSLYEFTESELNFKITFERVRKFTVDNNINEESISNVRYFIHNSPITDFNKSLFIYFQNKDSINYLIYLRNAYYKNDSIKFTDFSILTLDDCDKYFMSQSKYRSLGIIASNLSWIYKQINPNIFEDLFFNVKNNSEFDYNKMKFKIIFQNESGDREYFTKTLDKEVDLRGGDNLVINLKELTNIPMSFNVTNKNNWSFDVNLINVSPFPYFNEFNPKFK